jgi:ABC-type Co2+ transport system permease subunit
VIFPAFDLTSAVNLITLAALIQVAVLSGVINHASGFSVTPGSFIAVTQLALVPQTQYGNNVFFLAITKPVCTWYKTCINPSLLPGSHGPYSGATTGMTIK